MRVILTYCLLVAVLVGFYLLRLDTVRYSLHENDKVQIKGTISDQPKIYNNQQRITVAPFSFFTSAEKDLQYGDRVQVAGMAKSAGRYWRIDEPSVEKISTSRSLVLAYSFRERAVSFYNKVLPPKHAALLSGIVLGTKSSLDSQFFNALRNTGTLHVVVASGTNISLFAGALMSFLAGPLRRKWASAATVILVWLYILLIGWQAPIIRAGIMATVAFLAQGVGRESSSFRALVITAILMLLAAPLWLFDLGFQLSFLSTFGVIAFGGRFSRMMSEFTRIPTSLRGDLATSLGAQLAVGPLIFWKFGSISFSAPLVNPLVLWTIPLIMAGGMVLGMVGLVGEVGPPVLRSLGEAIGQVGAWFLWLPLEYFVRIVEVFG